MSDLQRENLDVLVRNGGFKFTDTFFPYTSGQIGPFYVNSDVVQKNGASYFMAVYSVIHKIAEIEDVEVISGGESKDWIFSQPASILFHRPHLMIYKDGRITGADVKGKKVVHVADLNNEGYSIRDFWLPAIEREGGIIRDVVFYVDRLEDGVQVVQDLGLNRQVVVPLDKNAWDYLKKINVVNDGVYRSLVERMEDKDSWARSMLRSARGLERLVVLLRDPKTCGKALKVIRAGYPDLKDELVDRIGSRLRVGVKL
ncbi:MAG TPA: hypothetical protein VJH20_06065 [Candidatus Nanoarchaeia archaeon]|nr:hypothetical protein [Candidatus Nanoarchaeia archaeon]